MCRPGYLWASKFALMFLNLGKTPRQCPRPSCPRGHAAPALQYLPAKSSPQKHRLTIPYLAIARSASCSCGPATATTRRFPTRIGSRRATPTADTATPHRQLSPHPPSPMPRVHCRRRPAWFSRHVSHHLFHVLQFFLLQFFLFLLLFALALVLVFLTMALLVLIRIVSCTHWNHRFLWFCFTQSCRLVQE